LSESTTGTTPSNGSCYESAREPLTLQAKWGNGLSANWHVRPKDRARLRAELAALDARLHELDHRRRKAINRQRYSRSPKDVSAAADDLKNIITEMDRVMTRSRAVEGKLLLLQMLAPKSVDPGRDPGDPGASSGDVSDHVVVEVYRDPPGTKINW
jgi:hypothetical protein